MKFENRPVRSATLRPFASVTHLVGETRRC